MRDAFDLDPAVVHLNHGSFGAVPRPVAEAQQRVRARAEANPMRFFRVEAPGLRAQVREVAATFLGVGPGEVAMVRNVTEAAATVLSSLDEQGRLGPGDGVVLSGQGYESVRRTVARWCARTGASYDVVEHDVTGEQLLAGYRAAIDAAAGRGDRVRLVVVDQITSPTGAVLPVAEVAAAARAAGALTFVDAAHVPGHVAADPAGTGADFWSGTWHKWGFAPRGTTALWVAEPEREGIAPLTTSWNSELAFPEPFDMHGTDDYTGRMVLDAAVAFWESAGGLGIGDRAVELLDKAVPVVAGALPAVDAPLPAVPAPCLRLVPLPDGVAATPEDADGLYHRLSALGVEVQVVAFGGRGYLRLSAAVYNELEDYERLAEVLPVAL
ncbi:MAG: aminotransferase class V-fold PLP-dependent enzyme [Nocardioides sp.]